MSYTSIYDSTSGSGTSPLSILMQIITFAIYIAIISFIVYLLYNGFVATFQTCHTKEGMSPAARYGRAGRLLNKPNGLIPLDKQIKDGTPFPMGTNKRGGDNTFSYLLKENTSPATMKLDLKTLVPDTSELPAPVQSGIIDGGTTETEYKNNKINPSNIQDLKLSANGKLENVNTVNGFSNMTDSTSVGGEKFRKRAYFR
jgi:hypothetical protein